MTFFEIAERKRRWSVFDDVPWDALASEPRCDDRALCAETFCGVEMFLPDYLSQGIQVGRRAFAEAWFLACWGYEESKHALVLREYLLRSGQRTAAELEGFERALFAQTWRPPFHTDRRMVAYGALQELTTFLNYRKHRAQASAAGAHVLAGIYRLIAADEAAHAGFYQDLLALYLEEDRLGTLQDIQHVLMRFRMPAAGLIADAEPRERLMRAAGVDRNVFLGQVVVPFLTRLKLTRADLARACAGAVALERERLAV
jgi:acyl-[acyl-carrier-protein] desaturase